MITEREIKLIKGWDKLTKLQKKIIEFLMDKKTVEGSQSEISRTLIGQKDPSNTVRGFKELAQKNIITKEHRGSFCVVLTLADDYDEKIIALGEEK